jgi:hypothetical protein
MFQTKIRDVTECIAYFIFIDSHCIRHNWPCPIFQNFSLIYNQSIIRLGSKSNQHQKLRILSETAVWFSVYSCTSQMNAFYCL